MGAGLRNGEVDQLIDSLKVKSLSKNKGNGRSLRVTATLTFLQFTFAIYATFLLYFMSPSIDVITGPQISWATSVAHHMHDLFWSPHQDASDLIPLVTKGAVCQSEQIDFSQKKSNDSKMIALKTALFNEISSFQKGSETLAELMAMPSSNSLNNAKVTVILNHFQRKTLCAQLDALLQQTLPFHNVWVLAFGSPNEESLRQIVQAYNDSRISFVGSNYDFKYYGRFQMALQADGADYVYIVDDDMIPGRKMLEILTHVAGTDKYRNSVLGHIGRILPFRQKDFTFPSYRKYGAKEAGIYLPDPAYGITVDRIMQVDFLSSAWFLSAENVKTLFMETPFTFSTGEDLHLSYEMQKYRDAGSFVLPVDPNDRDTWGDSEHRLAYVSETTVIHKDVVEIRDEQWWRALSRGYITQWAAMNPQQSDVFFYAHSLDQILDLAPLIQRFRLTPRKKAYLVLTGGTHCPCEDAVVMLGWPARVCKERRFKVFDLEVGSVSRSAASEASMMHEIFLGMKGLLQIHNPAVVITVADLAAGVKDALSLAISRNKNNVTTTLVQLPRSAVPHSLWMADLKSESLQQWNKMRISISIITQNRAKSLRRLLDSLINAHYLGDEIQISFNVDSHVDGTTLEMIHGFEWTHGKKIIRRRIIQGGLIRAVSESWYPSNDHEFGLLLEDDIEVSAFYYMWLKYAVLSYHYGSNIAELNSIALYTPRLVEVVKERPKWNATDFFKRIHPNTPYLHQLPCSWGALFFPKHWREFYKYMNMRYTEDAKKNPVQIPRSRTNGWQASWKKFLIDMMYLRGYVSLYPNFPNQTSFSTNHMEPGAHINASDNVLKHNKDDFTVPLLKENFCNLLPSQKLPSGAKLPVINLFNQAASLKGLRAAGAKLGQDVLECKATEIVAVNEITGEPSHCVSI